MEKRPNTGVFENGKFQIRLNQTIIKALSAFNLSDPSFCPAQVRHCNFSDSPCQLPGSEAQNKGLYFEMLALDLPNTRDISVPTLKNGKIPVDYERIAEQAFKFKELKTEHEIRIYERQTYLEAKYSDEIILFGTLDFVSTFREDANTYHKKAIIDLKLTSNVYAQYGDYSWAFPFNMDHTQPLMYNYLWRELYGEDLPFYYMVFDYSPKMNYKIFRKKIESVDKLEFHEKIRKAVEKIQWFDENGWNEIPEYSRCQVCPLKESCKSFTNKQKIEVI